MQPRTLLELALAAASVAGHSLDLGLARRSSSLSSSWSSEFEAAEAEERRYLATQWDSVEAELEELQRAAVSAVPEAKAKEVVKPQAKPKTEQVAKPDKRSAAKAEAQALVKAAAGKEDKKVADLAAQAMGMANLGNLARAKNSPAALAPMLAMLKGLYENGRDRIADLNKREKKSKERFAELDKKHKERLQDIQKRWGNRPDLAANATRDENKMYAYWPRCRDREHKQYHNMLKIQHATMQKEKLMIDMYEKTIKGQGKEEVEKKLGQLTGQVPEVVFVQTAESVSRFCTEALEEVRAARGELASDSPAAHLATAKSHK
jgi:hypothetical protein